MKQIFAGEIFEILPISNGIIFSYCKEKIDDNILVAYKMISFDTGRFSDIAKNVYLITKFGNNYKSVVALCDNYITVKSMLLPNGKIFLLQADGCALLIDNDTTPIWSGSIRYKGFAPSDIVLHNDALWASYSECNVLLRYNLTTMREELRIGGVKSPFNKPKKIFLEGDEAIVCNQDSQKLVQINLNTFSVSELENFEEAVYQYVKIADNRFVLLESGLYII